ncbi:MAG TPA: 23S rRNA (guanosine(2251)-2'-O)-methyltransferase RlmB [Actinomycetota bacterium]|nr:23S rRNA (guanosine(2251)-2'-O)-methyltransferase RlmB [Actinomycetota bacterium]
MPRPETSDDRLIYGRRPVTELLRSGAPAERVLLERSAAPSSAIGEIRKRAESAGVPIRMVPRAELDRVTNGGNHQGVAAITGRFRYADISELLARPSPALLFLDGITDPHNLGSLLRSADGAGFDGVVIPGRRAAQVNSTVRRVAAGAAEVVPVARVGNLATALDEARAAGVWVVGLDQEAEESLWVSDLLEPPVALLLGAEDRGIGRNVREHCDALVRIPSAGRLESLNVAVAGAVAMFEVARRRQGRVG